MRFIPAVSVVQIHLPLPHKNGNFDKKLPFFFFTQKQRRYAVLGIYVIVKDRPPVMESRSYFCFGVGLRKTTVFPLGVIVFLFANYCSATASLRVMLNAILQL